LLCHYAIIFATIRHATPLPFSYAIIPTPPLRLLITLSLISHCCRFHCHFRHIDADTLLLPDYAITAIAFDISLCCYFHAAAVLIAADAAAIITPLFSLLPLPYIAMLIDFAITLIFHSLYIDISLLMLRLFAISAAYWPDITDITLLPY